LERERREAGKQEASFLTGADGRLLVFEIFEQESVWLERFREFGGRGLNTRSD